MVSLLQLFIMPIFAAPQNDEEARHVAKIRADVARRGVGDKATVRIKLRNKTELKGYISHAEEDSFTITDAKSKRTTTIAYRDVAEVRGKGLSKGAKIAIAVGVGLVVAAVVVGIALANVSGPRIGLSR